MLTFYAFADNTGIDFARTALGPLVFDIKFREKSTAPRLMTVGRVSSSVLLRFLSEAQHDIVVEVAMYGIQVDWAVLAATRWPGSPTADTSTNVVVKTLLAS